MLTFKTLTNKPAERFVIFRNKNSHIGEPSLIEQPSLVRNGSAAAKSKGKQRYIAAKMGDGFKEELPPRTIARTCAVNILRCPQTAIIHNGSLPSGVNPCAFLIELPSDPCSFRGRSTRRGSGNREFRMVHAALSRTYLPLLLRIGWSDASCVEISFEPHISISY